MQLHIPDKTSDSNHSSIVTARFSFLQINLYTTERGLRGVEYVVSDSHEGLKHAISKVLPTALWQRCCVHFLRNARDKLSRSADPACLEGLKRLWGCEHVGEDREALGAWVARWGDEKGFGRLVEWGSRIMSRRR